jgi:hypothetical protein
VTSWYSIHLLSSSWLLVKYAQATIGNAIPRRGMEAAVHRKRLGRDLATHRCTKPLARAKSYATEGLLLRFQPSMLSMSGSEHVQRTCTGQKSRASVSCQQFGGLWLPDWEFLWTTTLLAFSGIICDINGDPAIPYTCRYLDPLLDQMYSVATISCLETHYQQSNIDQGAQER